MGQVVDPVVLEKGLKSQFFQAYKDSPTLWQRIATHVPSTGPSEKYGWLGQAPGMREWTDERIPKGLIEHEYTIVNRHYEATIAVDRDSLADDQTGQIMLRVRDLARRAKKHPDALLIDLLNSGATAGYTSYDGAVFYSNAHVEGDYGSQDNTASYTVAADNTTEPTTAECIAMFTLAVKQMMGLLDDQGERFVSEMDGLALLCPASVGFKFKEALMSPVVEATTNILAGAADVIVAPTLTDPATTTSDRFVHLLKVDAPVRPFIFQERQPVQFASLTGESDAGFTRRYFQYGVDARYNVGYGLWPYAVRVTITT